MKGNYLIARSLAEVDYDNHPDDNLDLIGQVPVECGDCGCEFYVLYSVYLDVMNDDHLPPVFICAECEGLD